MGPNLAGKRSKICPETKCFLGFQVWPSQGLLCLKPLHACPTFAGPERPHMCLVSKVSGFRAVNGSPRGGTHPWPQPDTVQRVANALMGRCRGRCQCFLGPSLPGKRMISSPPLKTHKTQRGALETGTRLSPRCLVRRASPTPDVCPGHAPL